LVRTGQSAYLSSMSLAKEFKEFISRGNVVDLAVGVIIGGAFGGIVSSLVKDVIMPPIGWLTSGVDFSSMKFTIQQKVMGPDPTILISEPGSTDPALREIHPDPAHIIQLKPQIDIAFGNFLNTLITFLIVAFVIFLVVKGVNSLKRKEAEAPAAPPEPTAQEKLLMEIRDLLAKK
jgi:large conductance mechanosensitive channel